MVERKWEGTTYGNGLMHHLLIRLLRRIDIRLVYLFAYVFVVPPTLFRPGFKFIYRFFRERFNQSVVSAFCNTYRNHCIFAEAVIDKFAMYAGRHFDVEIEGYEHFQHLANQPEGFVQLSSHVGNYEIAGYSLVAKEKPLNAMVFMGEKTSVMENRRRMFDHTNIRMIPIREDMTHLFELDNALSKGEIVSIPGDRIWGSSKTVTVNFLGKETRLPMGPFQVIAIRGLQALIVHVIKVSKLKYKVFVTPVSYDMQAPRTQQVSELSHKFVQELERIVRKYPTQWYNYFDFWNA
ncbi:MAG: lysophospholipid acyltransferase family protein [Prevotella sp.]|nr:lysophospholipid acyltransferase family protein [Prevotella sp.]